MRTQYAVDGWGAGELWTGDGVVLAHDFRFALGDAPAGRAGRAASDVAASPEGAARPPSGTVAPKRARVADGFVPDERQLVDPGELAERLRAFFAGADADLVDVPLDLGASTPFQRDVTTALRAIPRGEVVSYGELAAIAGYPRAGRAVGTVCATNRFLLFVPCHRVVGASGIGGYGSAGVGVKRRLLALEGVSL